MPAVRFMRKSRAIESQHGADLSRVGRNDTASESGRRDGVIGWDGLKKEVKRKTRMTEEEKNSERPERDGGNTIAGFTRRPRNADVASRDPGRSIKGQADTSVR